MRVLAILNQSDESARGGIQESAAIAMEGLRSRFDVVPFFVSAQTPLAWLRVILKSLRIRGKFDVCLIWHADFIRLLPFLRLSRRTRVVLFLHGTEVWRRRKASTRRLIGRCAAVFANSAYTIERTRTVNPEITERPTRVVALGTSTPLTGATIAPTESAAIIIARLDPGERYKGHEQLIDAWPRVIERIADAQLWIVGGGAWQRDLETLVERKQLRHRIRFFGRVDEGTKEMLISNSSCLVMPSTAEGFGLVYLEAMRQGRPCLTGVDAGQEVIAPPQAGLAVATRDPATLADAVVRLLHADSAWRESARARYETHYTAAHFQQRLCDAIAELV